jgi:apolipoprotein N-acyltransferase
MRQKYIGLAFISGVLLSLPWYYYIPGFILHIALIPLLIIEQELSKNKQVPTFNDVFLISSITFFTWNFLSMWWVVKISVMASMMAIMANTLLFSLMFSLFHLVKKKTNSTLGYTFFVCIWLAFEYYCLHGDFAQPWLTLGNGLANVTGCIQWYEYTGFLGGSLWILLSNLLLFKIWDQHKYHQKINLISKLMAICLIGLPVIVSLFLLKSHPEKTSTCNVAIIQPNIDPFSEKFSKNTQQQVDKILNLASENKEADYYLTPETAVDDDIWEDKMMNNYSIFKFREFLEARPKASLILGAITYKEYHNLSERTITTRYDTIDKKYYDIFNSAIQLDYPFNYQVYHKSKLVIGVERVPFQGMFNFLDRYLVNLGGANGSLGTQKERIVFNKPDKGIAVGSIICYESVYGEFVSGFVRKGANVLFIITNDGWWNGTLGYLQHLQYARLRAIENRRDIARCGNTGISAFINQKGEITKKSRWWEECLLTGKLQTNTQITFYTRHGDYIGLIASYAAATLIALGIILKLKK